MSCPRAAKLHHPLKFCPDCPGEELCERDPEPQTVTIPREVLEKAREALRPFARAEHIVASFDGDRLRCILSYPADEHGDTFKLASVVEARAAIAALEGVL